jgi:hypothetical protein
MAHFSQLSEHNVVTQVIVINNSEVLDLPFPESEPVGVAFCQSLFGADTRWAQTSYNANFRYNYAGIGYTFDAAAQPDGAFIAPCPGEGWVLNTTTYQWVKEATPLDPPMVL